MKSIISRLVAAEVIIRNLPDLPGYNGSLLAIDDTEAQRIAADIADCIDEIQKLSAHNEDKNAEFEAITRPVMDWLNKNGNPHMMIVIDPTSAVLNSGEMAYHTTEYVRD